MRTNELHQMVIEEDDMIDVLYSGEHVNNLVVDDTHWIERLKKNCDTYELPFGLTWSTPSTLSQEEFIRENLADWHLPSEYVNFDLQNYLLSKCKNDTQKQRVQEELVEFEKRGMIIVLKWLKYFVDTMRANNLIWGVGRGSSVSSYVLYLLDIHKVDSIQYDLDIKEFLK